MNYLVREEIKVIYGKPQRMYNGFLLLLVKNAERLLLVIGEFPHQWENHSKISQGEDA